MFWNNTTFNSTTYKKLIEYQQAEIAALHAEVARLKENLVALAPKPKRLYVRKIDLEGHHIRKPRRKAIQWGWARNGDKVKDNALLKSLLKEAK